MRRLDDPSPAALHMRKYREEREPAEARERRLRKMTCRTHNLTLEQFVAMRDQQKDRCKSCAEPLRLEELRAVHVDHDPKCCPNPRTKQERASTDFRTCGKCVRGLLCSSCNRAVGLLERYPHHVEKWMQYLRSARRIEWS